MTAPNDFDPNHISINSQDGPSGEGSGSGIISSQRQRASGIPVPRCKESRNSLISASVRSASSSNMNSTTSSTSQTPKWRMSGRRAVALQPSVGVSVVHAAPEQVQVPDAISTASLVIAGAANVKEIKKSSRESINASRSGGHNTRQDSDSYMRHVRGSSPPHSHPNPDPLQKDSAEVESPSRSRLTKAHIHFDHSPMNSTSNDRTRARTRSRAGSTVSITNHITRSITTPASATTSTSTPETCTAFADNDATIGAIPNSLPVSATETLHAENGLPTSSTSTPTSWFASLKKSKSQVLQASEDPTYAAASKSPVPSSDLIADSSLFSKPNSPSPPLTHTDTVSTQHALAEPSTLLHSSSTPPALQVLPATLAAPHDPVLQFSEGLFIANESEFMTSSTHIHDFPSSSVPKLKHVAAAIPISRPKASSTPASPRATSTSHSPSSISQFHSRPTTPTPKSAASVQSHIQAPKPRKSWFGSPSRATSSSLPISRSGSVPALPSKTSNLASLCREQPVLVTHQSDEALSLQSATVGPPLPSTPPPLYPLELKLDVDTVVDRRAMVAQRLESADHPEGVVDEEVDEPPVYTPAERAASAAKREMKAREGYRSTTSIPSSLDDFVPSLPHTPTGESGSGRGTSGTGEPGSEVKAKFILSLPLLGRTKLPLGSILGGGVGMKEMKNGAATSTSVSTTSPEPSSSTVNGETVASLEESGKPGEEPVDKQASASHGVSLPTLTHRSAECTEGCPVTTDRTTHDSVASHDKDYTQLQLETPVNGPLNAAATGSWWNYVGWMSTSAAEGMDGSMLVSKEEDTHIHVDSSDCAVAPETSAADGAHSVVGNDTAAEGIRQTKESKVVEPAEHNAGAETEALLSEAESQGSGHDISIKEQEVSTWFTPWSWYQPPTSQRVAEESGEEAKAEVQTVSAHTEPTIAAEISDVASAKPEPPPPASDPSPGALPTAHVARESEQSNPIISTLSTHRSGWAAFFSSPALVVKTLGYGGVSNERAIEGIRDGEVRRDDNGCEIMELDFEEDNDEQIGEEARRGRDQEIKLVGDPVQHGQQLILRSAPKVGAVNTRESSPLGAALARAKEESAKAVRLFTARTTRDATSSREHSPAPAIVVTGTASKVDVTATSKMATTTNTDSATSKRPSSPAPPAYPKKPPSAPSPPNLVLPTWADTFFVAPRSVLPLPPPNPSPPSQPPTPDTSEGVLGKTMKFMGNVLFSYNPITSTSPSHPDSRHKHTPRSPLATSPRKVARVASASSGVSMQLESDSEDEDGRAGTNLIEKHRRAQFRAWGQDLPKAWRVLEESGVSDLAASVNTSDIPSGGAPRKRLNSWCASSTPTEPQRLEMNPEEEVKGMKDILRGCKRVVVIGVHGWFPGAMIRTVLGEPTGTSSKFANMTEQALRDFEQEHGVQFEKITKIPLDGDGTIERRVDKLYGTLLASSAWLSDLYAADAILVATHSQGSIVSTHLIDRLIKDGHIVTNKTQKAPHVISVKASMSMAMGGGGIGGGVGATSMGMDDSVRSKRRKVQRVCCLALCGIHLGPLRYLSSSTLVGPYLQYFESTAARELFEFQNTESAVSKAYVAALENVVDHGTKMVYVASLNDQVVPIYSGLFTAVSHPLILRALYIDGDAYHSSDFLSNLLVLLLRILNAGMSDSGLLTHLSEATAGSLNGVGHSSVYEEIGTYALAVKYLFLTNDGMLDEDRKIVVEPFNAAQEQNDYEIPWSLRDIIADERVAHFFGREIGELRDEFREWQPKTTILRDLKRKLQPIQRLPSTFSTGAGRVSGSKL